MIRIDVLNFAIVVAFVTIWRFLSNYLAALTAHTPIGKALSIIAA